jgi:EAL domain-containing protein (putative c-di-GMP-specific phosphodiesterase class I)
LPPLPVAVNISSRQFRQGELPAAISQALAANNLPPALLELELTEGMLMRDVEGAIKIMQQLRALGVRLTIDDFGSGYSSLAYLRRFPIDCLKIDPSFIRDLTHGGNDATITRSVIALAAALHLRVIAEGVEEELQSNFLLAAGCSVAQGYLFCRPLPAADLEPLLRTGQCPAQGC